MRGCWLFGLSIMALAFSCYFITVLSFQASVYDLSTQIAFDSESTETIDPFALTSTRLIADATATVN